MSKPTVQIRKVTPLIAKDWLTKNKRNRRITQSRVAFYLDQMKRGQWQFVGDSIRFDTNDDLIDGQHRLLALIQYGQPLDMMVVENLEPEAFTKIDTGKSRSAGDAVSLLGVTNATTTAATVKAILLFKSGRLSDKSAVTKGVSNTDVVNFIKRHPGLEDMISHVLGLWYQFRYIPGSALCALYFILSAKNEKKTEAFFNSYATGAALSEKSPILILRRRLSNDAHNQTQFTRRDKMALFIHAWNAYIRGRELDFSMIKVKGEYTFPQPI